MNQNHVARLLFLTALFLGVVVYPAHVASSQNRSDGYSPMLKAGDRAPDFTLNDFDGGRVVLSKLTKDKAVLLWFTNLCEGCQSVIPAVLRLRETYRKEGVEVVAVSVLGKDRKTVETVMKEKKVSFRFLYDPAGTTAKRDSGNYVEGTCPLKNIFIIKKGGKIVYASHLPGVQITEITNRLNSITKGPER